MVILQVILVIRSDLGQRSQLKLGESFFYSGKLTCILRVREINSSAHNPRRNRLSSAALPWQYGSGEVAAHVMDGSKQSGAGFCLRDVNEMESYQSHGRAIWAAEVRELQEQCNPSTVSQETAEL